MMSENQWISALIQPVYKIYFFLQQEGILPRNAPDPCPSPAQSGFRVREHLHLRGTYRTWERERYSNVRFYHKKHHRR